MFFYKKKIIFSKKKFEEIYREKLNLNEGDELKNYSSQE